MVRMSDNLLGPILRDKFAFVFLEKKKKGEIGDVFLGLKMPKIEHIPNDFLSELFRNRMKKTTFSDSGLGVTN